MTKNNQLSKYANFDQIGGSYRSAKKEYLKREEAANSYIEKETHVEKKNLESALEKYNKKIDSVMKSKKFKKLEGEAKDYSQKMSKNLIKAKSAFLKIREDILKREDWDNQKKNKKIENLFEKVLSKLYDQKEMEQFKKMMANTVIVMNPMNTVKKIEMKK